MSFSGNVQKVAADSCNVRFWNFLKICINIRFIRVIRFLALFSADLCEIPGKIDNRYGEIWKHLATFPQLFYFNENIDNKRVNTCRIREIALEQMCRTCKCCCSKRLVFSLDDSRSENEPLVAEFRSDTAEKELSDSELEFLTIWAIFMHWWWIKVVPAFESSSGILFNTRWNFDWYTDTSSCYHVQDYKRSSSWNIEHGFVET